MRRRVLIARLDSAGDVLLAGPAVRAVAHQADRVTFLCGRRGRAAAELLPGVDDIVEQTAAWIDPEPDPLDADATLALVADLAGRGIDQAVILTSFHQSPLPLALLLRMAGVPQVAATCEDYPGSLLDVRHRLEGDPHEVQRSLSLVGALGYRLPPDDDGTLAVRDDVLRRPNPAGDGPYVVVHPGASVPARAWAPERHAALVRALAEQGRKVVVTGGPGEESLTALVAGARAGAGAGRRAPAGLDEVADLGGATELATLAVVLAGADAVVVANTGPAHLAAAVGTPVVSLFAPTVPAARWRPWSVPCRLLGHQDIGCAGCRARACPIPGHPCLGAVTVADVVAAVDELAPLRRPVGRRAS